MHHYHDIDGALVGSVPPVDAPMVAKTTSFVTRWTWSSLSPDSGTKDAREGSILSFVLGIVGSAEAAPSIVWYIIVGEPPIPTG